MENIKNIERQLLDYVKEDDEHKVFKHLINQTGESAYACKEYLFSSSVVLDYLIVIAQNYKKWHGELSDKKLHQLSQTTYRLVTQASLRITKAIYDIQDELFDELTKTPIKGDIPMQVFRRLPEWGIAIPIKSDNFSFAAVSLFQGDVMESHYHDSLAIDFIAKDKAEAQMVVLPLHDTCNIADMLKEHYGEDDYFDYVMDAINQVINILLYLCSETVDYDGNKIPSNPVLKKVKKGWRLFASDKVVHRKVGDSMVRKVREFKQQMSFFNAKKAPHIRRAHWHGYWTGKGREVFKIKWVSASFINKGE